MSLILDALKKLEREKTVPEPGVIVVGSVPWQGVAHARARVLLVAGGLAVLAVLAGAWWLAGARRAAPGGVAPRTSASGSPASRPRQATEAPLSAPAPRRPAPWGVAATPQGVADAADTTQAPSPGLRLNAISERDGHPIALIDGRLVREGDSFDGVRVLRIRESEVEVEVRGHRRVLRF